MPIHMDISILTRKLPHAIELPTLGGESAFTVSNNGQIITIKNSQGNECVLTENILHEVYTRYLKMSPIDRLRAGQYVDPKWTDCPDRIFSPYVAKVIDYILPI